MAPPPATPSWLEQLLADWKQRDVQVQPAPSPSALRAAENQLGFSFPADFVTLYSRVNGFANLDFDGRMFSFWPLERICAEYAERQNQSFIYFCDYLISSHLIGFSRADGYRYKSYESIDYTPELVTTTLSQLVALMLVDSADLY